MTLPLFLIGVACALIGMFFALLGWCYCLKDRIRPAKVCLILAIILAVVESGFLVGGLFA